MCTQDLTENARDVFGYWIYRNNEVHRKRVKASFDYAGASRQQD